MNRMRRLVWLPALLFLGGVGLFLSPLVVFAGDPTPTRLPSPTPPLTATPTPTRLPSPTPPGSPTATPTPSPTPPGSPTATPTPTPTVVVAGEVGPECYRPCAPRYDSAVEFYSEYYALPVYVRGYGVLGDLPIPDPGLIGGLGLYFISAIAAHFGRAAVLVSGFSVVFCLFLGPSGGWPALLLSLILVGFRLLRL